MADHHDADNIDTQAFEGFDRLKALRLAHRRLDEDICALTSNPASDQLELRRMKKRKLQLKDMITRLESELIPDLNA